MKPSRVHMNHAYPPHAATKPVTVASPNAVQSGKVPSNKVWRAGFERGG